MNKSESKYFKTAVKMDEALLKLLEKKDFEYITIKEVCAAAGVNRSTFYLHYENMVDLLEETLEYMGNRFSSYFQDDENSIMEKINTGNPEDVIFITEEHLKSYLNFIKDHRTVFFASMNYPERFGSNKSFEVLSEKVFYPAMEKFKIPKNEQAYIIMFYVKGIMGILHNWISNGCEDSVEFITKLITKMTIGNLEIK